MLLTKNSCKNQGWFKASAKDCADKDGEKVVTKK